MTCCKNRIDAVLTFMLNHWFATSLTHQMMPFRFPRLFHSKDAFQILWDVMQSTVVIFVVKLCYVVRLFYALYGIRRQHSTEISSNSWPDLDNDWNYFI